MGENEILDTKLIKIKSKQELGIKGTFKVYQLEFITDMTISTGAKELFMLLWCTPESFELSATKVVNLYRKYVDQDGKPYKKISTSTVYRYFDELERAGYLDKIKIGYRRAKGGVTTPVYKYTLYEISKYTAQVYEDDMLKAIKESTSPDIEF